MHGILCTLWHMMFNQGAYQCTKKCINKDNKRESFHYLEPLDSQLVGSSKFSVPKLVSCFWLIHKSIFFFIVAIIFFTSRKHKICCSLLPDLFIFDLDLLTFFGRTLSYLFSDLKKVFSKHFVLEQNPENYFSIMLSIPTQNIIIKKKFWTFLIGCVTKWLISFIFPKFWLVKDKRGAI